MTAKEQLEQAIEQRLPALEARYKDQLVAVMMYHFFCQDNVADRFAMVNVIIEAMMTFVLMLTPDQNRSRTITQVIERIREYPVAKVPCLKSDKEARFHYDTGICNLAKDDYFMSSLAVARSVNPIAA